LRYTLEFVVPLYGKPASKLVKRLVRVQDVLGAVQDAATLHDVLAEIQNEVRSPSVAVLLLITDQQMRAARAKIKPTFKAVRKRRRWKRLRRALDQGSIENDTSVSGVATATVP
jgi:CHAD domain-containing protein